MKSRNKKEALKIIQTRLEEGKPRKEILEELTNIYNNKTSVAKLIAMTPDSKTKEKYKPLNYLLICLLVLSLIAEMYFGFLLFEEKPVQVIVISFIVLLIYIALIYFVSKFKGFIYRILTWLVIISLINDLTRIPELEIWNMIGIILVLAFGGVSLYLNKKMFPNYGMFGLKKDKDGDYLLE